MGLLSAPTSKLKLHDTSHTISDLPDRSILVHATNCVGKWGAGFAKAVKQQYPVADRIYVQHCDSLGDVEAKKEHLLGTSLLIPPQLEREGAPAVWIACLFTSYAYGKKKDRPAHIMAQTKTALEHLRVQLEGIKEGKWTVQVRTEDDDIRGPGLRFLKLREDECEEPNDATAGQLSTLPLSTPDMRIYSPRFNAGNFKVPWEDTMHNVEEIFGTWNGQWYLLGDS